MEHGADVLCVYMTSSRLQQSQDEVIVPYIIFFFFFSHAALCFSIVVVIWVRDCFLRQQTLEGGEFSHGFKAWIRRISREGKNKMSKS